MGHSCLAGDGHRAVNARMSRAPDRPRCAPDPGFTTTPLHQVGFTPIYQPESLRKSLGMQELWIKDESRNPSASFKDRASALVIARAIEANFKTIIAASTGNAGAAMACMAASVGKQAVIIAPRSAPPAKVAQLLTFGARVVLVDGTYDQAFDLSIEASREYGWYNRNTGYNPYTVEGKKTAGLEIWEQVLLKREESAPNLTIFIPVGDGNILSGVAKGFADLQSLGWIEKLPRLVGVQAEGSAAIYNAYKAGKDVIDPVDAKTVADSICVDLPRDGLRALKRVRQSGGYFLTVSDQEILRAMPSRQKIPYRLHWRIIITTSNTKSCCFTLPLQLDTIKYLAAEIFRCHRDQ